MSAGLGMSAEFASLVERYLDAIAQHNLGRAVLVQNEMGTWAAKNRETIARALEGWEQPLSFGTPNEDA